MIMQKMVSNSFASSITVLDLFTYSVKVLDRMNNKLNIMLLSESFQHCEEQHTAAIVWSSALFSWLGSVPTHCM